MAGKRDPEDTPPAILATDPLKRLDAIVPCVLARAAKRYRGRGTSIRETAA